MSNKVKNIQKVNKMLLNESMPPPVYFNEFEVFDMLCQAINYNISGSEEPPTHIVQILQTALKSKGRYLGPDNTPKGAYN